LQKNPTLAPILLGW